MGILPPLYCLHLDFFVPRALCSAKMADNELSSEVPPASAAITPEFVAQQASSFEADPKLRLAQ